MFAIIRTRWQTRPLSRRAKRRSSAAPGSLRKKYAGIVHPPNIVRLPINSTTFGDQRKSVLLGTRTPGSIERGSITRSVTRRKVGAALRLRRTRPLKSRFVWAAASGTRGHKRISRREGLMAAFRFAGSQILADPIRQ